ESSWSGQARTPVYEKRGPKWCIASPEGPRRVQTLPRTRLNHRDALFPRYGKATHSQTWAGKPTWLRVRGDATHQTPTNAGAPCGDSNKSISRYIICTHCRFLKYFDLKCSTMA
ncbi:unnamed protein product, partial [Ixodes pacificus]